MLHQKRPVNQEVVNRLLQLLIRKNKIGVG
jgi:hypothetical protein